MFIGHALLAHARRLELRAARAKTRAEKFFDRIKGVSQ